MTWSNVNHHSILFTCAVALRGSGWLLTVILYSSFPNTFLRRMVWNVLRAAAGMWYGYSISVEDALLYIYNDDNTVYCHVIWNNNINKYSSALHVYYYVVNIRSINLQYEHLAIINANVSLHYNMADKHKLVTT